MPVSVILKGVRNISVSAAYFCVWRVGRGYRAYGVGCGVCSIGNVLLCFATVSGFNDMFPPNGLQRFATGFQFFGGCVRGVA